MECVCVNIPKFTICTANKVPFTLNYNKFWLSNRRKLNVAISFYRYLVNGRKMMLVLSSTIIIRTEYVPVFFSFSLQFVVVASFVVTSLLFSWIFAHVQHQHQLIQSKSMQRNAERYMLNMDICWTPSKLNDEHGACLPIQCT